MITRDDDFIKMCLGCHPGTNILWLGLISPVGANNYSPLKQKISFYIVKNVKT